MSAWSVFSVLRSLRSVTVKVPEEEVSPGSAWPVTSTRQVIPDPQSTPPVVRLPPSRVASSNAFPPS